MAIDYKEISKKLKALSDPKRLKIVDMLSCGELCACEILEKFDITQPTLSYDMKKLEEVSIVKSRRVGKNTYYSLNDKTLSNLKDELKLVFTSKDNCICKLDKIKY